MIQREIAPLLHHEIKRGKSILLLGPRQTGKSTLISSVETDLTFSLVNPNDRLEFEKDPSKLQHQVEEQSRKKKRPALVVIDEIQKVPILMDVAQHLIDQKRAQFILTGSSARKLKRQKNMNLLPGRVTAIRLDPFTLNEYSDISLLDALLYGTLPGICLLDDTGDRETDLKSYVTTYLNEEIRAEALTRNIAAFARFFELAASESGHIVNFKKLSQEIGVAHTTIMDYYQILEDCLIAERVEPITASKTRKKLTRSNRYLLFDLGVRRLAASEGLHLPKEKLGNLFEEWVGLEILRRIHQKQLTGHLRFWRDPAGPEVDWVVEIDKSYIPIEVKWTANPREQEVKHLLTFMGEYKNAPHAYVICQTQRPYKMHPKITVLPWQQIGDIKLQP